MALTVDHTFDNPRAAGGLGTIRHRGHAVQVAIPIATLHEGVKILSVRFAAVLQVK